MPGPEEKDIQGIISHDPWYPAIESESLPFDAAEEVSKIHYEKRHMNKISFDELKVDNWYWVKWRADCGNGEVIGCFKLESIDEDREYFFFDEPSQGGHGEGYMVQDGDGVEFFGPFQLPQILMEDDKG